MPGWRPSPLTDLQRAQGECRQLAIHFAHAHLYIDPLVSPQDPRVTLVAILFLSDLFFASFGAVRNRHRWPPGGGVQSLHRTAGRHAARHKDTGAPLARARGGGRRAAGIQPLSPSHQAPAQRAARFPTRPYHQEDPRLRAHAQRLHVVQGAQCRRRAPRGGVPQESGVRTGAPVREVMGWRHTRERV